MSQRRLARNNRAAVSRLQQAVRTLIEPMERRVLLSGLVDLSLLDSPTYTVPVPATSAGKLGAPTQHVTAVADADLWYLSRQFDQQTLGKLDKVLTPLQVLLSRDLQNGAAPLTDVASETINGSRYSDVYNVLDNRPHVEVYVDDVKTAEPYLKSIGMEVRDTFSMGGWEIVGGFLPVGSILALADTPGLKAARPSDVTRPDGVGFTDSQGTVTNQWEALTRADVWTAIRAADNGSGIDVGVISDSVNRVGTGLTQSYNAGNLPNPITVVEDAGSGVDEGRAMLELIYDVAPGANLFFHSAYGVSGHAAAFDRLRDQGVDIIADDIPNFSEPVFQQGPISIATEEVYTTSSVLSFLSAGNRNDEGYAATWSNGDADRLHNFLGGDETLEFTLAAGGDQTIYLHWDQPWGGSGLDIDIRVYDRNPDGSVGALLFDSNQDNTPMGFPIGNPIETLSFTNTSGSAKSYHVAFIVEDGPADGSLAAGRQLQMYMPDSDNEITWLDNYTNDEPAINPNRNADSVFVIGAVPWNNPGTIEGFSSRGPITRYYSDGGSAYGTPVTLNYPNFHAADGTSTGTTGFGNFFGTSAAAPNAAAVGALVLDVAGSSGRGDLTFTQMFNIFRDTAVGTNAGGAWSNTYGYGRIDALGAGFAAKGPTYREVAVELNQFGDSLLGTQNLFGITDVDGFYFATDAGGNTTITASDITASLDPAIMLYRDSLSGYSAYRAHDFDSGPGDDAQLTYSVSGLTLYNVEVFNQTLNTVSSDFNLSINGPSAFVTNLTLDANGDATLSGQSIQTDDADYYRIFVPTTSDGTLTITVTPTGSLTLDPVFNVYDSAGNQVVRRNAAGVGAAETTTLTGLIPGTEYVIRVAASAYATTGDFTLSVNFGMLLPSNLPASSAESFLGLKHTGIGVNSEFFNDANINFAGDVDSYIFAGHTGSGTYTIDVSRASGTVHPVIGVYDGTTGNLISFANNLTNAASNTLSFAGSLWTRYVVAFADNNNTDTGNLDITVTTPSTGGFAGDNVAIDAEGAGADSNDSLILHDTNFYRFTVPANGTGQVTVHVTPRSSAATDVAFMVFDATNTPIGDSYIAAAGARDTLSLAGLTPGAEYYVSVLGRNYETTGGYRVDVEATLKRGTVYGTKFHDLDGDGVIDGGDFGLSGWQIYADLNGNDSFTQNWLNRVAEPDSFLANTIVNGYYPGVTLTAVGTGVTTNDVTVVDNANASTSARVFANDFSGDYLWGQSTDELNAAFSRAVTSVSIDFISDDASDVGRLVAFNSANVAIATYTTASLGTGISETMTVTRSQGDIAYVRAYGLGADAGLLDNLHFTFGEPTSITNVSGGYSLTSIPGGSFAVREILQSGWSQSGPTGGEHSINITSNGQTFTGRDFFNYQSATLSGRKWHDANRNGVFDGGEAALAGWTIYLDLNNNKVLDFGEPNTVTTGSGTYSFSVAPGTYRVREVQQAFWEHTAPAGNVHVQSVTSGQVVNGLDFGNYRQIDFGDAPAPYPTLLADNGARHYLTGLRLGSTLDREYDGQPGSLANLDDNTTADDEDGVFFLNILKPGTNVTIRVVASAAGKVNGWIDLNRDGDWNDPIDVVLNNVNVNPGVNDFNFTVPVIANLGVSFGRFRISTAGGLAPTGLASDGEVEDYRVFVSNAIRGDVNCDGLVNNQDISPFVPLLTNPDGYAAAYPNCDPLAGDVNGDGVINNQDIAPFVALLTGPRPGGDAQPRSLARLATPVRGKTATILPNDDSSRSISRTIFADGEPIAA